MNKTKKEKKVKNEKTKKPINRDMKFYTLSTNNKFDPTEPFDGKIWFGEFNPSSGRLLKMYCTPETAEKMKKYGVVTEYQVQKADLEKGETPYTIIIPITNLMKYNSHLSKSEIYNSVKYVFRTLDYRFGFSIEKLSDMHVSILEANEQYSTASGKVFINFNELCSVDMIATFKELISGTNWCTDINDISGYTHYMKCYYSMSKK